MAGKLTDERFAKLSATYKAEQACISRPCAIRWALSGSCSTNRSRKSPALKTVRDWVSRPTVTAGRVFAFGGVRDISYYSPIKRFKNQSRTVIILMTSADTELMVSQRRSMTFSKEANSSFLKPRFRSSFHICSIGFISCMYGGIKKSSMFFGTTSPLDLCQAAPSQHSKITSSGCSLDNSRGKL